MVEIEHLTVLFHQCRSAEYRLGNRNIVVKIALPKFQTQKFECLRLFRGFAFGLGCSSNSIAPAAWFDKIRRCLKQLDCIQNLVGRFHYSEVDVLGTSINRLLKLATKESIVVKQVQDTEPENTRRGHCTLIVMSNLNGWQGGCN